MEGLSRDQKEVSRDLRFITYVYINYGSRRWYIWRLDSRLESLKSEMNQINIEITWLTAVNKINNHQ